MLRASIITLWLWHENTNLKALAKVGFLPPTRKPAVAA